MGQAGLPICNTRLAIKYVHQAALSIIDLANGLCHFQRIFLTHHMLRYCRAEAED